MHTSQYVLFTPDHREEACNSSHSISCGMLLPVPTSGTAHGWWSAGLPVRLPAITVSVVHQTSAVSHAVYEQSTQSDDWPSSMHSAVLLLPTPATDLGSCCSPSAHLCTFTCLLQIVLRCKKNEAMFLLDFVCLHVHKNTSKVMKGF